MQCYLASVACKVHSSLPDLMILSQNSTFRSVSCLALPCVMCSLAPSAARLNPLRGKPEKTRRGPFPLHLGPDIRNWLRKYYNGYQIFGNCFSFSELNICLVQAASTVTTWPYGSLQVADFSFPFFFFFPPLKKQENLYQITHDVNAKLCCEMTANMLFSRCLTRQ